MPSTRMRFACEDVGIDLRPELVAKLPLARYHRGDDTLARHDVFADRGIDVHHDESHERPHAEMMPGMHILAVRPDGEHPAKQLVLPAVDTFTFRIERETGHDHEGDE